MIVDVRRRQLGDTIFDQLVASSTDVSVNTPLLIAGFGVALLAILLMGRREAKSIKRGRSRRRTRKRRIASLKTELKRLQDE